MKNSVFLPEDEWKQKNVDKALEALRRSQSRELNEKARQNVLDFIANDRTIPIYLRKQE